LFDAAGVNADVDVEGDDDECRRLTCPFKEWEEPSGASSWISLQPSQVSFELIVWSDEEVFNYSFDEPSQLNDSTIARIIIEDSAPSIYLGNSRR
jgi:hypothetical protein